MTLPKYPSAVLIASVSLLMSSSVFAAVDGKEFYMTRCAACHGSAGQGTKHLVPALGPALKGNPFITSGGVAAIKAVIRKGRSGQKRLYDDTYPNMPAFGPEAVPDAEAVIAYLKGDMQK